VLLGDNVYEEGRFAGSGYAGEGAEDAERDFDIDVFEVVGVGIFDFEEVSGFADDVVFDCGFSVFEVFGGDGAFVFDELLGCAGGDDLATLTTGAGSELDDVVGALHDFIVVLNSDYGVAACF